MAGGLPQAARAEQTWWGREVSVYSDLAQRARAVSADLTAIFPEAPTPAVDAPRVASVPARAPRASAGMAGAIGVVLATGLVGLIAGALIARPTAPAVVAAARPASPPASLAAAVPAPIMPVPVVLASQAPAAVAPPPAKPRRARTRATAQASASATIARCSRLARADRAWCAHRHVMVQDRALRRAYARATRAGVPRATLAGYTRRWASLRRQAARDPGRVAIGYAAMSRELSQKAQRQKGRR